MRLSLCSDVVAGRGKKVTGGGVNRSQPLVCQHNEGHRAPAGGVFAGDSQGQSGLGRKLLQLVVHQYSLVGPLACR